MGSYTNTQCNDGADNDGDAKVDALDPNCDDANDVLEAFAACDDNQDNDLDGWIDLDDPGCSAYTASPSTIDTSTNE